MHNSHEFIVIDNLEERPGRQARHVSVTVSFTCPGGHPHSLRSASQYNPVLDKQSTKGPHEQVPLLRVVPFVCMHDGDRLHLPLPLLMLQTRPEPGVHSLFVPHLHTSSLGCTPDVCAHGGEN